MRLFVAPALLLTAFVKAAPGCQCLPVPQTPCEAARTAVVFRGRLIEATPIAESPAPGLPPPPPSGMRYRFQVLEDFSGAGSRSIELVRRGMTSCDPSYSLDTEYVVYARKDASGRLHPGYKCDRTRPVENAEPDLEYLRSSEQVRTVLAGTLRTRSAVLAGKRVVATTSSASFEGKTNKEGLFQILGLPPGQYLLYVPNQPENSKSANGREGGSLRGREFRC